MKTATRVKDKYYWGNKIVAPITEEEYNRLQEVRSETKQSQTRGFIPFGSDFVFDDNMKPLIEDLNSRHSEVKKELQSAKKQKLNMQTNETKTNRKSK